MREREIEHEMHRQRLSDELRALDLVNTARQPDETYEDCLRRRAVAELRRRQILAELCTF